MAENLNTRLAGVGDHQAAEQLRFLFDYMYDRLSSQLHTSAGLVIDGAGATFPKTGAATAYGSIKGAMVEIPAGQVLPAPTGVNTAAGQYVYVAYYVYLVNGVLTYGYVGGAPAASAQGAQFPAIPLGSALLGYLLITDAAAFTGGTTPLDTATTVYISPTGAVDPSATYQF
jgi:hypothetical protein